ncbi:MAG: NAD(P)/FAD-dependent oxidoreductase [Candidatus Lokiarchaeota archaeon]|nr:NAD(P)/FAD-dependent oxidoreductase [Candidatus Lokiarchaeota archaeon]
MDAENSNFYNFVIVGAGPAGLTAGITAARLGFTSIILEKGKHAGPKPRGESIAHMPIVDAILGEGFLPSIGFKSNGGRVWHSPNDLKITTTYSRHDHYFFEWRRFIDRFIEVANDLGVKILFNSTVIEPIEKHGITIGVKYKNMDGQIQEVIGNTVLDCSGFEGVIGKRYEIDYTKMNCPIIKCLISNANYDIKENPDLEFYFIGNGDLNYSLDFPPCVAYFFPLENRRAEVGLMLRMAQVPNMKTVKIPDNEEILRVWNEIKENYPGYNVFFKNCKIDYEEITSLPNAKMAEKFVPNPGVVILGDSAGFINPFGSSGLYYSMEMAKFWVSMITQDLETLINLNKSGVEINESLWTFNKIENYTIKFEEQQVYKEVKNMYNLIGAFEYKIFNRLRTSEKINKKWDYIASLLNQA